MDNKFKGIFTALLTPFDKNNKVNESELKKLVEFNLEKGINGFYVGGSTGESMVMTAEERKEVFRIGKEAAGDKVPMIAHCGAISTDAAIDMAKTAESLGYDAISAVAPFYYGFPAAAIKQYYTDIVSSVNIPMVIYNFPGGNGFTFTPDYAAEMFKDKRFIGIKHTSADLFTLQQFKEKIDGVTVFNGFDEMCLGGLAMGADAGIGSTYNVLCSEYCKLYDLFQKGDIRAAQEQQYKINRVVTLIIKYGVIRSIKYILTLLGIDSGEAVFPGTPLTDSEKAALKKELTDIGYFF